MSPEQEAEMLADLAHPTGLGDGRWLEGSVAGNPYLVNHGENCADPPEKPKRKRLSPSEACLKHLDEAMTAIGRVTLADGNHDSFMEAMGYITQAQEAIRNTMRG